MSNPQIPLLISAQQLGKMLGNDKLVLVDLQSTEHYLHRHIPGAINLNYACIVKNDGQTAGLLPDEAAFSAIARALGICGDSHVVAYDTEGGAAACRLIWTLHVFGHWKTSLLDGGLRRWLAGNHPLENSADNHHQKPGSFTAQAANSAVIDGDELLERLGDETLTVLDARSLDEHRGNKIFAARGGHIPGARHLEWSDALDLQKDLCLKPANVLLSMLDDIGVKRQHEIVVYCQTHRRSSLSYVMLKHLGYPNVRGYHGSWSEWGNRTDTPVEVAYLG